MFKSRVFQTVVPPLVTFILVIGLLEAAVRGFHIKPYICVPPSAVFQSLVHERVPLFKSAVVTAEEVEIGFAVSVTLGVTAAVILSLSKWVERAFYPYAIFFQTVPLVAIVPLLGPWFGYGMRPVVASAFIASVFPVIANTLSGLLSIDPAHKDMFKLYRAGPIATLIKLNLPSALPNILTGFRIAAGLVVVGTIVGEYMVSFSKGDIGLGQYIVVANRDANYDQVYAAVLLSSLLGLTLFGFVNLVGHLALGHWHASEQGSGVSAGSAGDLEMRAYIGIAIPVFAWLSLLAFGSNTDPLPTEFALAIRLIQFALLAGAIVLNVQVLRERGENGLRVFIPAVAGILLSSALILYFGFFTILFLGRHAAHLVTRLTTP